MEPFCFKSLLRKWENITDEKYIIYPVFCKTRNSSGCSFDIKILFLISKSFEETEKSDTTPDKKGILTFQQ